MRLGPGSSRSTVRPAGRSATTDVGNDDDRIRREGVDPAHMAAGKPRRDPCTETAEEPRQRCDLQYVGQNPGHAGGISLLGHPQAQHFRGFRTADPPAIRKVARAFA